MKETVPIRCNRNPVFEEGFLLLIPGNASQAELKVGYRYTDIQLLPAYQVRVRDSKGSALHSVDEELGSWRFALAKLFTLSEMRIPTQVNTSSLLQKKIKFCIFSAMAADLLWD